MYTIRMYRLVAASVLNGGHHQMPKRSLEDALLH